ncbi:hypothetical protein ABZX40_30750 [Streptomyces sp. NPDC004610]|uniref:hypothetical protein n=1 Tax=unclassified Streptomyces TaxID=2593676 RepID=UPI0033BDC065
MFSTERPLYDRDQPNRTGPLVVDHELDRLGLGDNWSVVGRQHGREIWGPDITPGDGWCRAMYAPECAWPRGAELCVVVQWFPDRELRAAADGLAARWDRRLDAVAAGLRGAGYVVERAGRPPVPGRDTQADLLVYRMAEGKEPPTRPAGAWGAVPPRRSYEYPEVPPFERLRYLARTARLPFVQQMWAREVPSCLWPPTASLCARLQWRPAPGGGARGVRKGMGGVVGFASAAGLRTQLPEREASSPVEFLDVLVYRDATPGPTTPGPTTPSPTTPGPMDPDPMDPGAHRGRT